MLTPASLKGAEAQAAFRAHGADAAVVVAYGLILPKPVLDAMPLGCFNVHASLLPRWRGAAPINRAVMAGDAETGVTVMKMDEGLDTGAMAMAERVPIGPDMTAGDLHDALARLGADLMVRALAALERGTLKLTPQPEAGVTYAKKIDKAETRIDWGKPWAEVHNHIRGLSPFPGAWCEMPGDRLKVLRTTQGEGGGAPGTVLDDRLTIACGDGAVRIVELQKAGGRPMQAEEFLRGAAIRAGAMLGWNHAALQDHHRIRRHAVRRLAVAGQRRSVQGALMAAVEAFCGEKVAVQGAGRTDAGVHALGQVAHFDLAREHSTDTVRDALNAHLRPHPVAVLAAEKVAADFDARRSALRRHYLYRIANRRARPRARSRSAPGACRARSTSTRCTRRRSAWSASTTSPPSARPNARPNRRSRRSTGLMSRAPATRSTSPPWRARSCTTRCARWSARWCMVGDGKWSADDLGRARSARPRRLRAGRAAGRALSGEGGLLTAELDTRAATLAAMPGLDPGIDEAV